MHKTLLAFSQIPQLSPTDTAYARGDVRLRAFYQWAPVLPSFPNIIQVQEQAKFPRADLVNVLKKQYQTLPAVDLVQQNIEALGAENGFCVVTAHQPSLFLGPMYFIYKAITTINLARQAEAETKGKNRIVPIFVLGSEDHDLEELNHINLFGKRIVWSPDMGGAVGNIPADTLQEALNELQSILGSGEAAQALFQSVSEACRDKNTFADVTQALLHRFLGRFGLVVLNMSEPVLKRHFIPIMRAELLEQPAFRIVHETIAQLQEKGFKAQAVPREINLFYLQTGSRERIVLEAGQYQVLNTELRFSETEILAELDAHPERFSPNVILRPLFQELILPNLAYVGGGGELAYWLERLPLFQHVGLSFPLLLRRNSAMFLDKDSSKKLDKFGISTADFFGDTDGLIRKFVEKNAAGEVDLSAEIRDMSLLFSKIAEKSLLIDPTLEKAVRADESKAIASIEQWQSRLMRAEKQKHEVSIQQIRNLKDKFFPGNGLQERHDNFLAFVLKYGEGFLDTLLEQMDPFDPGFIVLSEA